MTITREQVADLRPGDVVEVVETSCGDEITTRGPLRAAGRAALTLGDMSFRSPDGEPAGWFHALAVVSRAPRPLYVNHPRTEPVLGDVVRDGRGQVRHAMPAKATALPGQYDGPRWWARVDEFGGEWLHCSTDYMRGLGPITLLVDGETGQVVP